jgi:hypothetical protein
LLVQSLAEVVGLGIQRRVPKRRIFWRPLASGRFGTRPCEAGRFGVRSRFRE